MCAKSCQLCPTSVQPYGLQPARLLCPWDSPGNDTGVGYHALLQEIFPTQELNLCLLCLPALAGGFLTTSTPWESKEVYAALLFLFSQVIRNFRCKYKQNSILSNSLEIVSMPLILIFL